MKRIVALAVLALTFSAFAAEAQTRFIINGMPAGGKGAAGGARIEISQDQKLMLEAAKKVMASDFKGAETLYDQAISINSGNIDAYLQRGIVRRELGDQAGAAADGRKVVEMANRSLTLTPNDATLYHRRGMGLRLMKDFSDAKADISKAIQMSGQLSWKTDLQAVELEEKAFQ